MKRLAIALLALTLTGCDYIIPDPTMYVDPQYNVVCYRYYKSISCVKIEGNEAKK